MSKPYMFLAQGIFTVLLFLTPEKYFPQIFGSEEGVIKCINIYKADKNLVDSKNIDTCISLPYANFHIQKMGRKIMYEYVEEGKLDYSFLFKGKKGVLQIYGYEFKFIYDTRKKYFTVIFSGGCKFLVAYETSTENYYIKDCKPCKVGSLSKSQINSLIKKLINYGIWE